MVNAFEWENNGKSLKIANCIKGIYAGCSRTKVKLNSHTVQKSNRSRQTKRGNAYKTAAKSTKTMKFYNENELSNENLSSYLKTFGR